MVAGKPDAKPKKIGRPKKRGVKSEPKKRGRRPAEIDWNRVDEMVGLELSQQEIACVFGYHYNTLTNACERDHGMTYQEYVAGKKGKIKNSLRRKMYTMAMEGSEKLLIHLDNKYFPPQSTTKLVGPDDGPVQHETRLDVTRLSTAALKEIVALADKNDTDRDDNE